MRWDEFTVPYLTEVICVRCACLLLLLLVVEDEEEGLMQSPLFVLTCIESARMYMYSKRCIILI